MSLLANRYRMEKLVGEGGMGKVYLAHDTVLERKVAIKMLPEGVQHQPHARERLRREALAAAALDHPFICKIHEVGEDEGRGFIVMELIEGRTLNRVARDGGLSPRQLLDCANEIVQALEEAHRRGIVHRDLKPSNLMLTVHGHIKVLDFGLAKQLDGPQPGDDAVTQKALTEPGITVGTPSYMSPEQVLGSPLDPRSDVFSLGTVLHEMASGRHPFQKATALDTMAAILRDPPASTVGDLDIVPGFGHVIHRMLAKACSERYQTMGELRAALETLRDTSGGHTPWSGSTVTRTEPQERTPLVARDAELADLTAQLDRMLLGQGGFVLLSGEPGVGKTRLAREVQRIARARGCLTLTGQCYEQEGAPPFGPFAETVEQSLRLVPQAVRAALGDLAPEVATMAPVLRRVFPDIPDAPAVPSDQRRRLLFNAYLEYVRRGTEKSAVVLLLDDLQWADEASLELLLHIAPHLPVMRLLVMGTYRDVELDTHHPFTRTLETLLRQRMAMRVTVKRLSEHAVEQMLATMSGSQPPTSLVRVVHGETDGNPFFVEEVYQHLAEEGTLFDEAGRWRTDLKAGRIDVPEGVRLVISRRLERLGDDARRILTAAAVIGRSFPLDLLQAVTDAAEDVVLDLFEDAQKAQLLRAEPGRVARYTFVHELIRGTLVSAMALPRRQRLHAKVADAIERLRAPALDAHLSMLAHHLYQAGAAVDAERTSRVLLKAMARAQASGAFEEVLVLGEQLRTLDLPAGSEELATVEDTTAAALLALRRPGDAVGPATRALDIWLARRDDAGLHRAGTYIAHGHLWSNRIGQGIDAMNRALAVLSPAAVRERATLQTLYAGWVLYTGRFDEALAIGESARAAAEQLGDNVLLGNVYAMQTMNDRNLGRIDEAMASAERACAMLEGTSSWAEADAKWARVTALYYAGRMEGLTEALDLTTQAADRVGHIGALWVVRRVTAVRDLIRSGDLEGYRDDVAGELARPGNDQFRFLVHLQLAGALFCLGQTPDARWHIEAAEGAGATIYAGLPEADLCALAAWSGDHGRALDLFPGVERHLARPGRHNGLGARLATNIAALTLALVDKRDACAALYPALDESIRLGLQMDYLSLGLNTSHLSAGVAAAAAGLRDRALAHFMDARALAERLRSPLLRPLVDLWHGRHLIAEEDGESQARGEAMLSDAAAQFAALKMPLHQSVARRWLTR